MSLALSGAKSSGAYENLSISTPLTSTASVCATGISALNKNNILIPQLMVVRNSPLLLAFFLPKSLKLLFYFLNPRL